MLKIFRRLRRDQRGASLPEYAVLLALILGVSAATLTTMGTDITNIFTNVNNMLAPPAA